MNKKYIFMTILLSLITGIGAYVYGTKNDSSVYAQGQFLGKGGMRQGLQDKAALFGISVEELTELRNSGKTMLEIAKEKGISEDTFHQKVQEAAVARWQERGFTQEEIQERLTEIKERQENCDGTGNYQGMGRGTGNGTGRGFNR